MVDDAAITGDRLGDRIATDAGLRRRLAPHRRSRSGPGRLQSGFGALGLEVVEAPSTIEGVTSLVALAPDGTQVFVVIIPPGALASNPDLAAVADVAPPGQGFVVVGASRRDVIVAVTPLVAPAVARRIPEG